MMIEEVRELVRNSGKTYDDIVVGAAVGRSWLEKFMHDQRGDYGIKKVCRVRDFLKTQVTSGRV